MEFGAELKSVGGTVELGQLLGSGGFGKVYYGYDKRRKMDVAVKVIEKQRVESLEIRAYVDREIEVMHKLRNRFVVRLLDSVESPTAYNLIMELAPNGELFDKIVNADRFDEVTARLYFQQLICAVHYCHGLDIVHRDLKAENLLLGKDNELKVCDWGLSRFTREAPLKGDHRIRFHSLAGSIDYQAPEVLSRRGYEGSACDMWSCGAILFFMLCGYLPFTDTSDALTKRRILNCEYNRTNRYLSPSASDLISHLLEVDPAVRYNTAKVIAHPWFQVDLDPTLFPDMQHSPQFAPPVGDISASSFPRNEMSSPSMSHDDTSATTTPGELQEIRRAFATCNVNGTGFLDSEEVRDALIKLNGNRPVCAEEVGAFMASFTLDESGRISEDEFVAGWTRSEELGRKYDISRMAGLFHYDLEAAYLAEVRRAFDSIDVNHTGLITTESIKMLAIHCTDEEIKDFFHVVDPEMVGNGMLSFEQFVHLCSRYDLFKNHPIVQRLRRLEEMFAITDIRWMQSYTGTGFTVACTRENVVLRIKSQKSLSTQFEGKDRGFMYGTYTVDGKTVLQVGLHLTPTLPGYTRVAPYRIVGRTRDFHAWFLKLRQVLRHEILRCEEDTVVKGKPELM